MQVARKCGSSPRLARTPDPDLLSISETLYSLQTASSVTLVNSSGETTNNSGETTNNSGETSPTLSSHPPPPSPTPGRSRATQNARLRLMWIEGILLSSDILTNSEASSIYQELLEIQKSELVHEATQDACWSLILKQIWRGHADALTRALVKCPIRDIRAFFDDLFIRKPNWRQYLGTQASAFEDLLVDRTRSMILQVISILRCTLDFSTALALCSLNNYLVPLALLFDRPAKSKDLNSHLFFTFLAHLNHSCEVAQQTVISAVRIFCKEPATDDTLIIVVAHVLRAIQPLAAHDPHEADVRRLRSAMPSIPPWSPRKYLARHSASPFLSFAIFLADYSPNASRLLLEGGLVRTLEALYDQDFPDPRVREDEPYVQPRDELYKLCLRLLVAVSKHCDLRDCVLMDELKSDLRRCSRQLSEQYFGVFWVE